MESTELLEEIFLLRYIVLLLILYCVYLNIRLKKHIRASDLWQGQFFALKNTFLKLTKTK